MEIPVVQTEDVDEDKPEVLNDTIDDDVSIQRYLDFFKSYQIHILVYLTQHH